MCDEPIAFEEDGHEFVVENEYRDGCSLVCRNCLERQFKDRAKDDLEAPTVQCRYEWLRKPDAGFLGVMLRNTWGFRGRELIAVNGDGVVKQKVRVYDDDRFKLIRLLEESWGDDR